MSMTSDEAFRKFYRLAKGPVHQPDFEWALRETCRELMTDPVVGVARPKPWPRPKSFVDAIEPAVELLITWYTAGAEVSVEKDWADLSRYVVKRRGGAVWATFLRKSHAS